MEEKTDHPTSEDAVYEIAALAQTYREQRDRAVRAMHTLEQSIVFSEGDWTEVDAVLAEPWAQAVTRPQSGDKY